MRGIISDKVSCLTLCFCFGIIFGGLFRLPFGACYIFAVICACLCAVLLKNKLLFNCILILLVFIIGALWLENAVILPKNHISQHIYYKDRTIYNVRGVIDEAPIYCDGKIKLLVMVSSMQFREREYICSGRILVHAKEAPVLSYGDEVILLGNINMPPKLYRNKIDAVMFIKSAGAVVKSGKNKGFFLKRWALYLKSRIAEVINGRLSPLSSGILGAMILGDKINISPVVYDAMVKSGTVHILVVSGFNVGIVAFMILLFLKILRFKRPVRYLVSIFCLIIYCFATGASPPVVRSTIMATFFLLALLIKREINIYNSFFLAALFILLINPKEIFSISFQLSFVSVFSLIFIYPKIKKPFNLEILKYYPLKIMAEVFFVSLSAWLGTFGLVLYYFKIFSPVTVLANLFIVPLATIITLSGFALVIVSLILPVLGSYFAYANETLVFILLKANNLFLQIPFASFCF